MFLNIYCYSGIGIYLAYRFQMVNVNGESSSYTGFCAETTTVYIKDVPVD